MSAFDVEQVKTSEKMSDLVMEYVAQFIAHDFHEAYGRARGEVGNGAAPVTPAEFDDRIYKKITKLARKSAGNNFKALRFALSAVAVAICAACIAFTAFAMCDGGIRVAVVNEILSRI